MSWSATIGAANDQTMAFITGHQARSAARRDRKFKQKGLDELTRQFDVTREDYAPWREAGERAIGRMEDPTAFEESPGYAFRRKEGMRDMENIFSAKSGGGNAMRALNEYNQNLATNEFGSWWNRQAGMAGMGQTATTGTAAYTTPVTGQKASIYSAMGDNAASIGMWNAANMANAMNSGASNMLYGWNKAQQNIPPTSGAGTGGSGGGGIGIPANFGGYIGGPMSDIRLKENIESCGEFAGLQFYTWDWNDTARGLGIDDPTTGVIAQEVQKTHPHAVSEKDGYLMVDYDKLFGG